MSGNAVDTIERLEHAVLAVLAGATTGHAATQTSLPAAQVADAVTRYRAAGHGALAYHAEHSPWQHVTVHVEGRAAAEHVGIRHLGPKLEAMRAAGTLTAWWFLRKSEGWRLRYLPHRDTADNAGAELCVLLVMLRRRGAITGWAPGIYEPEIHAFGGPEAMDVAHDLFSTDSRLLLSYLSDHTNPRLGRRELMLLLPTVMNRAAGLDWYEQGHVWAGVAHGRTPGTDTDRIAALAPAVRTLLRIDIDATGPDMRHIADAAAAYAHAGTRLRDLAARGQLCRGLRAVCARHVIFTANRLGVPYHDQALLIATAKAVILESGC